MIALTVIDPQTGKYPDVREIAIREKWANSLCYSDIDGFAIDEDGNLILLDECGRYCYPPVGRFECRLQENHWL
jgi:hypothetical protein